MRSLSPSRSFIDEPFRFVGGHIAADYVNTVNWESGGLDRDRLGDYERVVRWCEEACVIDSATSAKLRSAAKARRADANKAYRAARLLRDVLHTLLEAVANGTLHKVSGRRALADFNAQLSAALPDIQLGGVAKRRENAGSAEQSSDEGALAWTWTGTESRLDAILSPVIWNTAQLLTSPDAARVRMCESSDCGWIYVDRSRNGLRRWCEMQTCGTLEKSRRRAARQLERG